MVRDLGGPGGTGSRGECVRGVMHGLSGREGRPRCRRFVSSLTSALDNTRAVKGGIANDSSLIIISAFRIEEQIIMDAAGFFTSVAASMTAAVFIAMSQRLKAHLKALQLPPRVGVHETRNSILLVGIGGIERQALSERSMIRRRSRTQMPFENL